MTNPTALQQATAQTIRTSKSLLWGISIALSWTWGIGLFFSVQMAVQFGLGGLISFVVPNALGLVLFGYYTHRLANKTESADIFEQRFFDGARNVRGILLLYQVLAIVVTLLGILKYAVMPLGISVGLVAVVFFGISFFLGEEFDITRIKYSHGYFFIGILLSMLGLLGFVLPTAGLGGVLKLEGAWPTYIDQDVEPFGYYMYFMIPIVVGFLLGPWLDLQQWQRAVQIKREGLSILGSYVAGAIVFAVILLVHGFLALAIWRGSPDLAGLGADGMFQAKDVLMKFFLLPDSSARPFFGFYIAFLTLCAVTTFDSGYIALRWYLTHLVGESKSIVFSVLPTWLFTSPLPWFFCCGCIAVAGAYLGMEIEYIMAVYGSFLVGYQVVIYRALGLGSHLPDRGVPMMKLFAISLFSIAIFGIGYFYYMTVLMAIGALTPLIYGIYLTSSSYRERAPIARRASGATVVESAAPIRTRMSAAKALVAEGAQNLADAAKTIATGAANVPLVVAPQNLPVHAPGAAPMERAIGARASSYFEGKWFVHTLTATYADTNSVGNVYFGTYALWVGKTRELFFNTVMPEFDLETTDFYILTRSFEHKFLREAKEFTDIKVRLRIADYNRKFTTLEHQVLDGQENMLGKGKQTLFFVSAKDYSILDIPQMAIKAFVNYTPEKKD